MHHFVSARLLIFLALLLVLESSLSPFFLVLKGRPDLLSLLVLDYAFSWSWEVVPFFALFIGLLRDFIGGHLFGIETAAFALTGFLLSLGIQKLDRENSWVRLGICLVFVFLTESLSLGLGRWLETSKNLSWELMASVILTTIYTAALAPGFFWISNRWFRRHPVLKQYELF